MRIGKSLLLVTLTIVAIALLKPYFSGDEQSLTGRVSSENIQVLNQLNEEWTLPAGVTVEEAEFLGMKMN